MDVWAPANAKARSCPSWCGPMAVASLAGPSRRTPQRVCLTCPKDFVFVAFNYRLGITGIADSVTAPHQDATDNVALYNVEHGQVGEKVH